MKKLLATTALAVIATTGAASAQSVLERVLSEIDNSTNLAQVNGTFANIAENIGGTTVETFYTVSAEYGALLGGAVDGDSVVLTEAEYNDLASILANDLVAGITENEDGSFTVSGSAGGTSVPANAFETREAAEAYAATVVGNFLAANSTSEQVVTGVSDGIDGSITNILDGITEATQVTDADGVTAIEWDMPTVEFGDMATTALGAVNTGDITLGVNSTVDEAKTSSTQAVSSVMEQLGGADGNGVLVLNIASNMTGVNGSISNTMTEVNAKTANLSTTALGAVNTGTITSGVNAAVQGIVGTSGSTE